MSIITYGPTPVHVFVNVFSFLNFLEIPVRSEDRTGSQQGLYSEALTWGRGAGGHCVTAVLTEHRSSGGICKMATLTRDHPEYDFHRAMVRDNIHSRRYFRGSRRILQGGALPWTIYGPGPSVENHYVWSDIQGLWELTPFEFLDLTKT